ncbi:MAG: DUF47 domain-containing protein [Deltaproteobacteria bacterium]|nr:DUF47 domain-containing protein [Deltaproteobacteria bacterium]
MAVWFPRLFAESPFGPLIDHQKKVAESVALLPSLVDAALAESHEETCQVARELSKLEHQADELKNRLRDSLPNSRFMQVSRGVLLDILSIQDHISDTCEDIGVLFTMRHMEAPPPEVAELLRDLVVSVVGVVSRAGVVVSELKALAGVSFSGYEAQRVLGMIELVDREEHNADKVQDQLAKAFFRHEDSFKPAAIYVWMKIFANVGDVANLAETMMHRIRLFMAK